MICHQLAAVPARSRVIRPPRKVGMLAVDLPIRAPGEFRRGKVRVPFEGRYVAVAGFFNTPTGLGRVAELVALTLEDRGIQVVRVDVSDTFGQPYSGTNLFVQPAKAMYLDISDVICVFSPDFDVLQAFDAHWLADKCLVAHWIWEIENIPQRWVARADIFDEICVGTEIMRETFAAGLPGVEVGTIPYRASLAPAPAMVKQESDGFVVGYSFAAGSNYYRKNAADAVRAFQMAFPENPDARLYLRCHDLDKHPIERAALIAVAGEDSRVMILGSGSAINLARFYGKIDVYLSPSRVEGYGLNLVEASQLGIPVICCGWRVPAEVRNMPSVHLVFYELVALEDPQQSYSCVEGARWAAPSLPEMTRLLVKLASTKFSRSARLLAAS